jgi:hypothetical protein
VGDPWLSITLTLCHILHSVSHWPVLVYFIYTVQQPFMQMGKVRLQLNHLLLTFASCFSCQHLNGPTRKLS